MKYFTGIDVSLRSVSICVVDETGEVRHEAKVAAEIDTIVATLRHFSGEIDARRHTRGSKPRRGTAIAGDC